MRIQTIDVRGKRPTRAEWLELVPRAKAAEVDAATAAAEIIADVRERGEVALLEQSERFDRVRPSSVRVAGSDIAAAVDGLDADVRRALERAIERVRTASAAQLPTERTTEIAPGARIVQRHRPVTRVGLYVPGGKAVYPSSVVMNVVPAQVAGVRAIAIASPAQAAHGGSVHPVILGAAGLLGVDEVYAMGGAGAVGAFAHGVPSIGLEPVDVVTGPGNVFVAAAKRVVSGLVGIDAEAGPTEILVIADGTADAALVAADLVSQAEHDELAAAVLVTDSTTLADAVRTELERAVAKTRHADRVLEALGAQQSAIVIVDELAAAVEFSNAYGPEHLELQVEAPDALLGSLDNAGAVFVGSHSPVSLGDYLAGSNHVLPTLGTSRFSSALGVHTFMRSQQVVEYDARALRDVRDDIRALSDAEDLPAHGDAIDARFPS